MQPSTAKSHSHMPTSTVVEDANVALIEDENRVLREAASRERELIIEPGRSERHYWRDLWQYRELFQILAWRDISVRYKQTVIWGRLGAHPPIPNDGGVHRRFRQTFRLRTPVGKPLEQCDMLFLILRSFPAGIGKHEKSR